MASTDSASDSTESRVITGWKRVAWPILRTLPLDKSAASLPAPMQQISEDVLKIGHESAQKHHLFSSFEDMKDGIHFERRNETGWHEVIADIRTMLQGEEGWGHVKVHMEHSENWAGAALFD
ncbi:uncharacterized protein FFB14_04560 [Fusarium fujikuroi]|nr:uncharacterized protein FFB14_04560 [Fusarium fujikuroi]